MILGIKQSFGTRFRIGIGEMIQQPRLPLIGRITYGLHGSNKLVDKRQGCIPHLQLMKLLHFAVQSASDLLGQFHRRSGQIRVLHIKKFLGKVTQFGDLPGIVNSRNGHHYGFLLLGVAQQLGGLGPLHRPAVDVQLDAFGTIQITDAGKNRCERPAIWRRIIPGHDRLDRRRDIILVLSGNKRQHIFGRTIQLITRGIGTGQGFRSGCRGVCDNRGKT